MDIRKIYKFNRTIIGLVAIGPFIAYFLYVYLSNMDFFKVIQLLCFVGAFLIVIYRSDANKIVFPAYLLFYLFFIFYEFYSAFIQLDREFKIIYLFSNRLIGGFLIMFIIENIQIPEGYFKRIIKISRIILMIAIAVILIQQIVNPNFFLRTDLVDQYHLNTGSEDRLLSIYSWLGLLSIGFSFVPVFLLVVEDSEKRNMKGTMIWILAGLMFALLCKSRWVMVYSSLVFVIYYLNHKKNILKKLRFLAILPVILLVGYVSLDSAGVEIDKIIENRVLEKNKGGLTKGSASTRLLAFEAFDRFFWENPIFGVGNIKYGMGGTGRQDYKLERFLAGKSSQIHVGYLSLFYMYGLLGALMFITFLVLFLSKLYRDAKFTGRWASFLGLLGFGLANFTLVEFSVFELGIIITLTANKYYVQNARQLKIS